MSDKLNARYFGDPSPGAHGRAYLSASALIAHTGSSSKIKESAAVYQEIETLNYLWVIEAKGLKHEHEVLELVSLLKSAVRGFEPVQGNFLHPFTVVGSQFKSFQNGVWSWEVDTAITLIRSPDEEFIPFPDEPFEIPEPLTFRTGLWKREPFDELEGLDRDDDITNQSPNG
jgi:hypothetical protein